MQVENGIESADKVKGEANLQIGVQIEAQIEVQIAVQIAVQIGVQIEDQIGVQIGVQIEVQIGVQSWIVEASQTATILYLSSPAFLSEIFPLTKSGNEKSRKSFANTERFLVVPSTRGSASFSTKGLRRRD